MTTNGNNINVLNKIKTIVISLTCIDMVK